MISPTTTTTGKSRASGSPNYRISLPMRYRCSAVGVCRFPRRFESIEPENLLVVDVASNFNPPARNRRLTTSVPRVQLRKSATPMIHGVILLLGGRMTARECARKGKPRVPGALDRNAISWFDRRSSMFNHVNTTDNSRLSHYHRDATYLIAAAVPSSGFDRFDR